jgi:hypothetical protein
MNRFANLVAAFLAAAALSAGAAEQAWVQKSNEHAQVLLKVFAEFGPEQAAQNGVESADADVTDLKPKVYERSQKATKAAIKELKSRLDKETDPSVKQDLQILITSAEDNYRGAELANDKLLPYVSVPRVVFTGIQNLLDARVAKERQKKALVRLARYAGQEKGFDPIAKLARDRTEERFGDKLIGPFKGQVEQDLNDTPNLVAGIKDLLQQSGLPGWEKDFDALSKQITEYDAWVKAEVLPRSRTDFRLPPEIYSDNLHQYGVDIPAQQLMAKALTSFAEIRNEMRALAPLVAKEKKFKSSDYRDVIHELKKNQVTGKEILPFFQRRLGKIEQIIVKEGIATVPARKANIEIASPGETAIQPAPHMKPPQLIGNTGQAGIFMLPLNIPTAGGKVMKYDDFTSDSATWTITAHEARPGHEMQFAAMVDKGVSIARAIFAFNSVNVEGWALYAEAETKPYEPLDGQLFALQARLQRAARAFLDPMLNLGKISPEDAKHVMMEDVCLSDAMATQEVNRYTFRAPGQATSYFYGYQRLMQTRTAAELALKDKFDRKAFNDFVLSQGLLPPDLLEKAVLEDFVPQQKARTEIAKQRS